MNEYPPLENAMRHFDELKELFPTLRRFFYVVGLVMLVIIGRVVGVGLVNALWTP